MKKEVVLFESTTAYIDLGVIGRQENNRAMVMPVRAVASK